MQKSDWLLAAFILSAVLLVFGLGFVLFIKPRLDRQEAWCQSHGYGVVGTPGQSVGYYCIDQERRLIAPGKN